MLRNLILGVAVLFLAAAVVGLVRDPTIWPLTAFALLVVVGTVFERRYHNRPAGVLGGAWQRTDERFRDETSGRLVTVWFNPKTGERRYVEDEGDEV